MTPRIAVLVPTRARASRLHAMLMSMMATAAQPEQVELVIRHDDDDAETQAYLEQHLGVWMQQFGIVCCRSGPRLGGYATLATLINEAAGLARADLLIVVNDDVIFRTEGWDRRLADEAAQYPDGIFDLGVDTVLNNPNFVFPCQSRRQVELLGCFYDPRLVYTDIWLRDVVEPFGRAIRVNDVTIEHQWIGLTPDQIGARAVTQSAEYQTLYAQCVEEGRAKIRAALPC